MITIIPAIDIIEGKCVRLSKGDFDTRKTYFENPAEVARMFEDAGIRRLHVVDLDGAKQKKVVNWEALGRIVHSTKLQVDFGGGIQSGEEILRVFEMGVRQVTIGSIAVKNPGLAREWLHRFRSERIIIAADFSDGRIAVSGWQEKTQLPLEAYVREKQAEGFRTFLCTDISRDGMLQGPAFSHYVSLKRKVHGIELIASGGISDIRDVEALSEAGIDSVIIGKAFYEKKITLEQLEPFLC